MNWIDGVSIGIGCLGTMIAAATALIYVLQLRAQRGELRVESRSAAVDEAVALAHVRGEVIEELERKIDDMQRELVEGRQEGRRERDLLRKEMARMKDEFVTTQSTFAKAINEMLRQVLKDLERIPPDVPAVMNRLKRHLGE